MSVTTDPDDHARHQRNAARAGIGCAAVIAIGFLILIGAAQARERGLIGATTSGTQGSAQVFSSGQLVHIRQRPAPDFTLQQLTGEDWRLSAYRGHPLVMNFWASWCVPCRDEARVLEQGWQRNKGGDVVVVGIDVWDTNADAQKFIAEFGVTYPTLVDPLGRISIAYGLAGSPETYFVNRDGLIVHKWIGPLTAESLQTLIDQS
jgi:cytochrome c biogenesis protein CcmG/thiol:disulfide interchange protein DsbE